MSRNRILIVRPDFKQGHPPRDLKIADFVLAPIDYQRGSWSVLDSLNDNSVRNMLTIYASLKR